MGTNFLDRISRLFNKENIGFRKKAIIFSFFLLIAIIIWFLKALEKNYTTEINYPVRYSNFPEDKTLIGDVPDYLKLQVYAHGYVLLQHKISSRYIPLVISVKSFSLKQLRGADSGFYFIETRFLKDYIDKQLSSEFEIIDVNPDTLVFPFADVVTAKIPVKSAITYELGQQLILKSNPGILPDSVMVTGPDYILDTLNNISTKKRDLGIINRSVEIDVGLLPVKYSELEQAKVKMNFEVEKFTEKTISVPVRTTNLPDSLGMVTFPPDILISCQVGLSNYERVQPSLFSAVVNYLDAENGQNRLKVNLLKSPDFVRSLKYSPKSVEYLIEKK